MKVQADKNRSERQLDIGDMVYLKLEPYLHTSLSIHRCLKLHSKYYGPFQVLEKIGNTTYKLLLLGGCQLHHTFHISQLKKHLGPHAITTNHLPLLNPDGIILIAPEALLGRKLIQRKQGSIPYPSCNGSSSETICLQNKLPGRTHRSFKKYSLHSSFEGCPIQLVRLTGLVYRSLIASTG
jgi:hypothetical protein